MSWITIAWSAVASACLTLAAVHLLIWCKQTGQRAHLLFALTAAAVAALAACELRMMRAQTPEQFAAALRWAHLPVFCLVASMVGFVRLYFRAGRPWLGYAVCGLRLLALIINFWAGPNLNYQQITGLRHLRFFGETVSVAKGVPSPWTRLGELSSVLLLAFVVDASVTLWRRGDRIERRRAAVVGGSMACFILAAAGHTALVNAGLIESPYLISWPFLAIVGAMGYELSSEVAGAARLTRQLQASEAACRESEARFRTLVDTAPVMVWMSGPDKLCTFFNRPWLEFTGRTLEQERGNGWAEGVHPEDLPACLQTYTSRFDARRPFAMEYRLRRADGQYRWVLDQGVPRYAPEGQFAGYIGSCIDLTERRQAEAALGESEQYMRLAADAAGLAMWAWDIPRNEAWSSAVGRALFGFAPSDKLSVERFLQALHPQDREAVRQALAAALNGQGEYESEYRVVAPDGQVRWMAGRGRVEFEGGRPRRLRGVSLDVTRRKQAEERFRAVVEAAPHAMIMADAAGQITLANAQAEAVFGYGPGELVGRPVEALIPERFRAEHARERTGYLAEPQARAMGAGRELYGRRKDGREVPVEIGLNPVRTAEGLFVLASIVDITERRRAELEAARQRDELAHLSRVMLAGELSGALAHELNQPLTAILTNAQTARRLLAQGAADEAELQDILTDVVEASHRATHVILRLRLLLKKGELQRRPLAVNEVVGNALKLMRSDLARRRVTVAAELAPRLPAVMGDGVQLQQVLLNLLVNGCEAMAGVEGPERRLLVRTELAAEGVRVSVVDRGGGIAPEQRERLFEPFFTTKGKGMGLGLAICRTIISAHGGRLWATNNPDRGATFQFTLPPSGGA
jgi:PAS domain S-box-containing protein